MKKPVETPLEKQLKDMVKIDESKRHESLLAGLEDLKTEFRDYCKDFCIINMHSSAYNKSSQR